MTTQERQLRAIAADVATWTGKYPTMGVDAEAYSAYLHIMSLRGQALEGIQERYKVLQVYYSEWDGKPTIVLNLKTKKDNDKAS